MHSDGFTSTGPKSQLEWFQNLLDGVYECKHHWLGPSAQEEQSVRILNRIIRWGKDGTTYGADPRHVEVVIEQLKLQEARGVTSPGAREEQTKVHESDSDSMALDDASKYRMWTARSNYLSMGRPDIQYSTKEASKFMAKPKQHHWQLLKELADLLLMFPDWSNDSSGKQR